MALLVAVEGLPGSGKTTVIGLVVKELAAYGIRAGVADIERTAYAPVLRPITRAYPLGHPARILLFWVLRLQQYDAALSMKDADIVFLDRFWGSTLAFDVYGHGMPKELVKWFGDRLERIPDITIFLDAPLTVVRRRKQAKTMQNARFARRVMLGYRELARTLGWVRVDATRPAEAVMRQCLAALKRKT